MTPIRRHRGPKLDYQHQRLDRGLPLGRVGLLFGKRGDVARRVAQHDQLSSVRQLDWLVELTAPA